MDKERPIYSSKRDYTADSLAHILQIVLYTFDFDVCSARIKMSQNAVHS
jgi:hypothetical protein